MNPLRSASSDPTTAYNNIAWCGLCQPLHSQFLVSEIQSRHAIATFTGRLELPPLSRQLADIQEKREHMRVQFKDSPRHTMMVSVSVLDELGEDLGVTPTLGRLLRTGSFEKMRAAYWAPMSANHYRLVGEGAREDAAEQIWQEYTSSEYRHAKTSDRLSRAVCGADGAAGCADRLRGRIEPHLRGDPSLPALDVPHLDAVTPPRPAQEQSNHGQNLLEQPRVSGGQRYLYVNQ